MFRFRLAALVALVFLSVPRDARADYELVWTTAMTGVWQRELPPLLVDETTTAARVIGPASIKPRGGVGLLGFTGGVDVVIDRRLVLPILGAGAAWAVGGYDTRVVSYDGSVANLSPWSTSRFDVLLPGIGQRGAHRRYMWGAAVRPGIAFLKMDGYVAGGAGAVPISLTRGVFNVQAELEACRRMSPDARFCLQVAPRLYENTVLSGLSISLRAEWGR